ncbi:ribosome maturation factor RimP [Algimonas arctica]|uniref:Ribosome maturation factor RimP n=1 Tax=Algimonas arctica TaxID=1479486 RepID=A0A8J3CQ87_9PROT|nr:ribosome maturation factor RimP [Algimonas arctica]GHA85888.1 ribosome maturation factor RimP [Algimonas arctica]
MHCNIAGTGTLPARRPTVPGAAFFIGQTTIERRTLKTKTHTDERILELADPIAADLGLRIVRVRVMAGKRRTVQIMAERLSDGMMGIENCQALSRELSAIMEVEDPLDDAYVLEVSSPGMDRPLTAYEDFTAYEGYLARLELDRLVEGRKRFRGVLAGVDDGHVDINLDGDEDSTASIPFDWIVEAKLLITDELVAEGQRKKDAVQDAILAAAPANEEEE